MTEKQPLNIDEIAYQGIVRKINLCSFETSKGTSVTINNVQRIISEHIKEFLDNLPKESTYESGYQKGRSELIEEIEEMMETMSTSKAILTTKGSIPYSNGYSDGYKKALDVLLSNNLIDENNK